MKTLNIVGCGKVGKAIGRLAVESQVFRIGGVLNRTVSSSEDATRFLGDGTVATTISQLPPADVTMISTEDSEIQVCARKLAEEAHFRSGDIAFHCSGALSSDALSPLVELGVHVASVHPVKSFADESAAVRSFAGTFCGLEGSTAAVAILEPAFQALGARTFSLPIDSKALYHAAIACSCNGFVALLESSLRMFEAAGLERSQASEMIGPLVDETLRNVLRLGPAAALTGPIMRGDVAVVMSHIEALDAKLPDLALLYCALGAETVKLALKAAPASARNTSAAREQSYIALSRLFHERTKSS